MNMQKYNGSKHSACTTPVCRICRVVQETGPSKVRALVTTKAKVDEPFGEYVKFVEVKPFNSVSAEVGK